MDVQKLPCSSIIKPIIIGGWIKARKLKNRICIKTNDKSKFSDRNSELLVDTEDIIYTIKNNFNIFAIFFNGMLESKSLRFYYRKNKKVQLMYEIKHNGIDPHVEIMNITQFTNNSDNISSLSDDRNVISIHMEKCTRNICYDSEHRILFNTSKTLDSLVIEDYDMHLFGIIKLKNINNVDYDRKFYGVFLFRNNDLIDLYGGNDYVFKNISAHKLKIKVFHHKYSLVEIDDKCILTKSSCYSLYSSNSQFTGYSIEGIIDSTLYTSVIPLKIHPIYLTFLYLGFRENVGRIVLFKDGLNIILLDNVLIKNIKHNEYKTIICCIIDGKYKVLSTTHEYGIDVCYESDDIGLGLVESDEVLTYVVLRSNNKDIKINIDT